MNKIQHVLWRIQNLNFSINFSIKYIFILCETNNLDHPRRTCQRNNTIWNPRVKNDWITRGNINH